MGRQLEFDKNEAIAHKEDGRWIKTSSKKYIELCYKIAVALKNRGMQKGDRVAIVTNNRPEWNFFDMGCSLIGVITVPIYPTISTDEYRYILNHCEPSYLLISDELIYRKISPLLQDVKSIKEVYSFSEIEKVNHWKELLPGGQLAESEIKTIDALKEMINPSDTLTIIYTSGTTGIPKGVEITHHNIVSNFITTSRVHELDHRHIALSFLPLCHIYERMMNYHFQYKGISIYYAENFGTIAENIREIKPHVFNTVPRLLETVYDKIISKGKELTGLKRRIFFWANNLALNFELSGKKSWWYYFRLAIADKLVFSKWRKALGDRIELIVSGGAALQPRLARVFWAAKLKVLEGYGLSETSPVVAVNRPLTNEVMFGTVGIVMEDMEVKISEEGEILCKGPNVMKGYYKAPELTKEVIDDEGWFHTGDIGEFIAGKYLKINDRKKEIFKLSSGKYIAPQMIENKFRESLFIEQLMVIGENEKFASALISPNFNYLHKWAVEKSIDFRDNETLIEDVRILDLYQKEVGQMNKSLGATEQIKRFRLVCEEWSPDSGELSPTLKLKREVVAQKYKHLIEAIYSTGKQPKENKTVMSLLRKNLQNGIKSIGKAVRR